MPPHVHTPIDQRRQEDGAPRSHGRVGSVAVGPYSAPGACAGTGQLNLARAAAHSASLAALRALKVMPTVPKASALLACAAPRNTSAFQVIAKSTRPAATTVASSSASSRAPAIQPVHKSIWRLAS